MLRQGVAPSQDRNKTERARTHLRSVMVWECRTLAWRAEQMEVFRGRICCSHN
jgi:hypothetical protein